MVLDKNKIDSDALLAAESDSDALARLCEHYYPLILSFMHYRVHPDCAEDMTSIVFCRVVQSIVRLKGSFNSWIYTIARNVVIDHYRYNGKRSYVVYEDGVTQNIGTSNYGVISMFNTEMDLQEILNCLDEKDRELLVLRFIQGCSSDEVAAIMDLKPGTVRAIQARLLNRLRTYYKKEV